MYKIIKQVSKLTDSVLVGFSCGKESIVLLDLCSKYFKTVQPFFMYLVPELSFQEIYLKYMERKYKLEIIRMPHWSLSGMISQGAYAPKTEQRESVNGMKLADFENEVCLKTGINWIAYGHRRNESIERQAMLKRNGGIDIKSRKCYPLADFTEKQIYAYLKYQKIQIPVDYRMFKRSFGCLWPENMAALKSKYPGDFEKIKNIFPFVEASAKNYELNKQIPEV